MDWKMPSKTFAYTFFFSWQILERLIEEWRRTICPDKKNIHVLAGICLVRLSAQFGVTCSSTLS